jgi:hypothetical protein
MITTDYSIITYTNDSGPSNIAGAARMLCCVESERCTGAYGIATYFGFAKRRLVRETCCDGAAMFVLCSVLLV